MKELTYEIEVTSGFEKLYMNYLRDEFKSFCGVQYCAVEQNSFDEVVTVKMLAHPDYEDSIKTLAAERFDGKFI